MLGVAFDKVSGGNLDLCDLKVTGYEDLTDIFGNEDDCGVAGEFSVTVLNKNGGTEIDTAGKQMKYQFFHDWDEEWDDAPYWKQFGGSKITPGKVSFGTGDGVWFQVNNYAYTTEQKTPVYSLVNSGEAQLKAKAIKLRAGIKGVGVPLSADVDLLDMTVKGYEDLTDIFGNEDDCGVAGEFSVTVLNKNGGTAIDDNDKQMKYQFFHDWDEEWDAKPYWKQFGGSKITEKGKVTFKMGSALWVQVNNYAYTTEADPAPVYTLEFPGIDDQAK